MPGDLFWRQSPLVNAGTTLPSKEPGSHCPSPTHLLAHKEAGSHSQPVGEVVYGVGQQVEIATDLGEGRESWVVPSRQG